jgi:signal transduction histidine kinase
MTGLVWTPDSIDDRGALRSCVRDLVRLSSVPERWADRMPDTIADSLRDLLMNVLRSDRVFVQLAGRSSRKVPMLARAARRGELRAELEQLSLNDDDIIPDADELAALRFVSYPIGMRGEMGRFGVGSLRADFPTNLETQLMQATANEIATALRQATLLLRHEEVVGSLRSRVNQQDAVARLSQEALTDVPLRDLLQEGVRTVREALDADCSELLELTPDGGALFLSAASGWSPGMIGGARVESDPSTEPGYALLAGVPVIVQDSRTETRFGTPPMFRNAGIVSSISVVLHGVERPFGVLGAHSRAHRVFTTNDAHFLQSIANLLTVALQRRRAESEREQLLARTRAAHAEAERVSRDKTQHLAYVSHELRTPLNAIAGYVEIMEMGIHGPLTEPQRSDLARIRSNQRYLMRLINNVLTFMKLDAGQVAYEPSVVSILDVLESVEEMIRPLMQAKHLKYKKRKPDREPWVLADGDKVQQVLVNLLTNATKFTEPRGTVEINFAGDERVVRTRVRDSGCGIPTVELERVFEPFVQVKELGSKMAEGTGLGLAISRQFAEAMHGRLYAESVKGKGSVFTLELPRSG